MGQTITIVKKSRKKKQPTTVARAISTVKVPKTKKLKKAKKKAR